MLRRRHDEKRLQLLVQLVVERRHLELVLEVGDGAQAVVKGLRAITDFEYEFQMTALNYQLDKELETLFIMSTPQHMYLSSSIVREIASLGGDVSQFVPPCVNEALVKRYAELHAAQ